MTTIIGIIIILGIIGAIMDAASAKKKRKNHICWYSNEKELKKNKKKYGNTVTYRHTSEHVPGAFGGAYNKNDYGSSCNHSWSFERKGNDKTYPRYFYKCNNCRAKGVAENSGGSINEY